MSIKHKEIYISDIEDIFIRRERDSKDFKKLIESISNVGLIIPITVRRKGDKYELIKGQGRLEAHKKIGKETIKAYVEDEMSGDLKIKNWLVENVVRQHLSPYDKARMMKYEYEKVNDIGAVAKLFGVAVQNVKENLSFFDNASPAIKEKVENKELDFTPAKRIVSSVSNAETQNAVVELISQENFDKKSEEVLIERAAQLEKIHQEKGNLKITVSELRRDIRYLREEVQNKKELLVSYENIWELGLTNVNKLGNDEAFLSLLKENNLELLTEEV